MINNKTMGHHRERIQGQPIRFEQAASQHEAVGAEAWKEKFSATHRTYSRPG